MICKTCVPCPLFFLKNVKKSTTKWRLYQVTAYKMAAIPYYSIQNGGYTMLQHTKWWLYHVTSYKIRVQKDGKANILMPKGIRKINGMEMTLTDACKHLKLSYHILHYKCIKPTTCTCFGHSCCHPQGVTYRGHITETSNTNTQIETVQFQNVWHKMYFKM